MIDLYNGDCLEVMKDIPDDSVDSIITDPPYGTTFCSWDSVIDLDLMWLELKRIIKKNGVIILFGSEPFSSALRMSNINEFKYDWVWEKGRASGHLHSKNKPLKAHENIMVFSEGTTVHKNQSKNRMTYNPIMELGKSYKRVHKTQNTGKLNHTPSKSNIDFIGTIHENLGERYPRSVLKVKMHNVGNIHPTQKPVELMEYLIKTYTNKEETVLDFTMGSGTTCVVCINTYRNFIGIELDKEYFDLAKTRIYKHKNGRLF